MLKALVCRSSIAPSHHKDVSGSQVIQVFARAPVPGQCKTRLLPVLSPEACASLHETLLRQTVKAALSSRADAVQLWCTPDLEHAVFQDLGSLPGVTIQTQVGHDLGARMLHALSNARVAGQFPLLIGCDCPKQSAERLDEALRCMGQNLNTMVFRTACDGGYAAVGTGLSAQALTATSVFDHVPWGANTVMRTTRFRLQRAGIAWVELAALPDVDEPSDLRLVPPEWRSHARRSA
jgi:uncharacterized protein